MNKVEQEVISIGSINFARNIDPDIVLKRQIEKQVMADIIKGYDFHVPAEYSEFCKFEIQTYGYGDKSHSEIVLKYNWKSIIDTGMEEHFWKWVSLVELYNFNSPQILQKCQLIFDTASQTAKDEYLFQHNGIIHPEPEKSPIAVRATIIFPNIKQKV